MSGIPLQLLWSTLKPDERAAMLDQVVKDLANFFALSVSNRTIGLQARPELKDEYKTTLLKLRKRIPVEYHGEIDFVEGQIDKLFKNDWPMVIGNLGAGPSNCFFDSGTYRLQGCTNWSQIQWATAVKAGNVKWDERVHVALALGRLLYVNDALNKMSKNKRRMKEEEETLWAYLELFARDKWMAGEQKPRGLWDDALEYRD